MADNEMVHEKVSTAMDTSDPEEDLDSLMYVNDDCLRKICGYLDIDSLCQMFDTCKRLRTITVDVFPKQYKELTFVKCNGKISLFRRILCKFGGLITYLRISKGESEYRSSFREMLSIDIESIAKYAPTIENLFINSCTIKGDTIGPLFKHLINLELSRCYFVGNKNSFFSNCPALESLCFLHSSMRNFPSQDVSPKDVFIELLSTNPQLRELIIGDYPDDENIRDVIQHAKNLETLIYGAFHFSGPGYQSNEGLIQLSTFKTLRSLKLSVGENRYADNLSGLMEAFSKEHIAIRELDLEDFCVSSEDIKSIYDLKTIEKLSVGKIMDFSNEDLVSLVNELPSLTKLDFKFGWDCETSLTADALIKMAKNGKKLEHIGLYRVRNLEVDQKVFEMILKAVQCREQKKKLEVSVRGCPTTVRFTVPESIQRLNKDQFRIQYSTILCLCLACEEREGMSDDDMTDSDEDYFSL